MPGGNNPFRFSFLSPGSGNFLPHFIVSNGGNVYNKIFGIFPQQDFKTQNHLLTPI